MPDSRSKAKLTASQRTEILVCAARGMGAVRIREYIKEKYQISLNITSLHENYIKNPKYKGRIERTRQFLQVGIAKHPLAQKINRLDINLEAINEALTWRLDKIYFHKDTGEEIGRVEKRNIGVIANLLEQARKEVEGDRPDKDTSGYEDVMIELIRKADQELKGVEGIRITRKEHKELDRFMAN